MLESDVDFAVDVLPFFAGSHRGEHVVKSVRIIFGEIKVRDEIEWFAFAQIPAMMQPTSDRGEIFQANGGVPGTILENAPPLVLREAHHLGLLRMGMMAACVDVLRPRATCFAVNASLSGFVV